MPLCHWIVWPFKTDFWKLQSWWREFKSAKCQLVQKCTFYLTIAKKPSSWLLVMLQRNWLLFSHNPFTRTYRVTRCCNRNSFFRRLFVDKYQFSMTWEEFEFWFWDSQIDADKSWILKEVWSKCPSGLWEWQSIMRFHKVKSELFKMELVRELVGVNGKCKSAAHSILIYLHKRLTLKDKLY